MYTAPRSQGARVSPTVEQYNPPHTHLPTPPLADHATSPPGAVRLCAGPAGSTAGPRCEACRGAGAAERRGPPAPVQGQLLERRQRAGKLERQHPALPWRRGPGSERECRRPERLAELGGSQLRRHRGSGNVSVPSQLTLAPRGGLPRFVARFCSTCCSSSSA